jgi:hypothetical protein
MSVIVVFDSASHHVVPKSQHIFRSNLELEVYTKTFRMKLILVCVGPVSGAMYSSPCVHSWYGEGQTDMYISVRCNTCSSWKRIQIYIGFFF